MMCGMTGRKQLLDENIDLKRVVVELKRARFSYMYHGVETDTQLVGVKTMSASVLLESRPGLH